VASGPALRQTRNSRGRRRATAAPGSARGLAFPTLYRGRGTQGAPRFVLAAGPACMRTDASNRPPVRPPARPATTLICSPRGRRHRDVQSRGFRALVSALLGQPLQGTDLSALVSAGGEARPALERPGTRASLAHEGASLPRLQRLPCSPRKGGRSRRRARFVSRRERRCIARIAQCPTDLSAVGGPTESSCLSVACRVVAMRRRSVSPFGGTSRR
jgi:hypothetical protein